MLSGSQVEAGNLVFHTFSMQSFTFAGVILNFRSDCVYASFNKGKVSKVSNKKFPYFRAI
jgi:hypothetical protein